MSFDELEVKKLSLEERDALAKVMVESLDELPEAQIEAQWVREAERRLDELEQGRATEVSAEQVRRRIELVSRGANDNYG